MFCYNPFPKLLGLNRTSSCSIRLGFYVVRSRRTDYTANRVSMIQSGSMNEDNGIWGSVYDGLMTYVLQVMDLEKSKSSYRYPIGE